MGGGARAKRISGKYFRLKVVAESLGAGLEGRKGEGIRSYTTYISIGKSWQRVWEQGWKDERGNGRG